MLVGGVFSAFIGHNTYNTLSPLIRNRISYQNLKFNFKGLTNYRNRHFLFYGFIGGIVYEYIVNQERFVKNDTMFKIFFNHVLFGGLLASALNIKYSYKGAFFGAVLGSYVSIKRT